MQNYMKKLDNMKKYVLPLLFLVMTFIIIPKGAYYKKENLTIKIETTGNQNEKKILTILYPKGYNMEGLYKKFYKSEYSYSIKNTIVEKYVIREFDSNGYIKKISFNDEEIIPLVKRNYIELNLEKIPNIYKISYLNIIIYLIFCIGFLIYFLKKGIEISEKNIGIFFLSLVFLSLALNFSWLSKTLGLFFAVTFIMLIFKYKKITFGKLESVLLVIFLLSFLSELFGIEDYKESYNYFQNSLLILFCMKIWKFNLENKTLLKKLFKYSLILLGLINILSPLVMGGIYAFTFGTLMIILCLDSLQKILKFEILNLKNKLFEIVCFFVGLYGVIISGRRTMIVVFIIYIIYLFFKNKVYKNKKKLVFYLIAIFSILLSLKIMFPKKSEFIQKRVGTILTVKGNESNYQRVLMWRRGYYIIKENLILGIGSKKFYKESIEEKYNKVKLSDENFNKDFIHVHNEYIHQIITRGIFGAILFYGVWIYILSRLRKSEDKDFDIILVIIYAIYGIFDAYSIRAESMVLYIFISISFINCLPEREKEKEIIEKIGYISTIFIFIIGLYFNKRFRYYFFIVLSLYLVCYFYQRKRGRNEKI